MTTVYALNLFDLAPGDDYRAYARRSARAAREHGGRVVAVGRLAGAVIGDTEPRQVMLVVEWPSRSAFDAFRADGEHAGLHGLRERGTQRYLWWLYDRLEDLGQLFPGLVEDVEEALERERERAGATAARPRGRLQELLADRARRDPGAPVAGDEAP